MTTAVAACAALVAVTAPRAARAESPAVPYVMITDVSVKEGDGGTTAFSADVRLSWPFAVEVYVSALPGTAGTGEYAFTPVRLSLSPGVAQRVTGTVNGDLEYEGDERFQIGATAVSPYPMYVASSGGAVTIVDDDEARAARLRIEGARVAEGDAGTVQVAARVRLEPASSVPVSVDWATAGRLATPLYAGADPRTGDFVETRGTLVFAPGETDKSVLVAIVGDEMWERDETVAVVLSAPRGAVVVESPAEIVIANDDAPAVPSVDDLRVAEGDGAPRAVALMVRLDRPAPRDMKLHVNVVSGSATNGEDFLGGFATLYPATGAREAAFEFALLPDTKAECDEGILVEYRAIYAGDETLRTARLLVEDDDGPRVESCLDPFVRGPDADGGAPRELAPPPGDGAAPDWASFDGGVALPLNADKPAPAGCTFAGRGPIAGFGASAVIATAPLLLAALRRRCRRRSSARRARRPLVP